VVASELCEPAEPVSVRPPLPVGTVNELAAVVDAAPLLVAALELAALELAALEVVLELLLLPHAATATAAAARTNNTPSLARTLTIYLSSSAGLSER
jgi:hypothetical protein